MSDTPDDVSAEIRRLAQRAADLVRADGMGALALANAAVTLSDRADSYHAGIALRARAQSLRLLGRYAEAARSYEEAVASLTTAGAEAEVARTLIGQVDALLYLGDYQGALDAARRSRAVMRSVGDDLAVAKLDMNVGNLYFRLGDHREALRHYRRAKRVFQARQDELQLAAVEANIGNTLAQLDRFAGALRALTRARERYVGLGLSLMVATIDLNLGYVWSCRGHQLTALHFLFAARRVFDEQGAGTDVATTNLDIAESYLALNMLPETIAIARAAAAQFEAEGMAHERAQALVYQATALARSGSDSATDLCVLARSIFEHEGNRVWCALIDLRLSHLSPDAETAAMLAERAERVFAKLGLTRRVAESRLALGRALARTPGSGQHRERAHDLFRNVSASAARLGLTELGFRALHERARLTRSLALYHEAAGQLERLRLLLGAEALKIAFAAGETALYTEMLALMLEHDAPTADVFRAVEATQARALADRVAHSRKRTTPGRAPSDVDGADAARQRLREHLMVLETRMRALELEGRTDQVAPLQAEAAETERQLVEHARAMAIRRAIEEPERSTRIIGLHKVQQQLKPTELLLEYFVIGDRVGALTVQTDRAQVYESLARVGDITTLNAKIRFENHLCALRGEDWVAEREASLVADVHAHLRELHPRLVGPLCLDGVERLVVVPHGPLHAVPFSALHDGQSALMDRYEIVTSPSATAAWGRQRAGEATGPAFVLGAMSEQAPLVEDEARAVARRLGVRPHTGTQATCAAFRRRAPGASLIHLAGHASLRVDNPAFSAIHLADGPLAVHDIDDLDLSAELAVLSGCSTGVGTVLRGGARS